MRVRKKRVSDRIYLLKFDNQREMAKTLLRFQEYYECPVHKGRIFTLEEYKKWYRKKKGRFSYYKDWNGFNVPSRVLKPFYDGRFDPLSEGEKKVLRLFENVKGNYYIVAVAGKKHEHKHVLKHELAHGLFHVNPKYRKKVLGVIREYEDELEHVKNEILSKVSYSEEVLEDEVQAYAVSLFHELESEIPAGFRRKMHKLFNKYIWDDED